MSGRLTWARIEMWWCLSAQFSRPVRALSPRRRSAHTEMQFWAATPGNAEALLRTVLRQAARHPSG
ncbi:hypothetical protein AB0F92_03925 [Kitasatospora aureofaciens]|uniref:hypothetical protein n=1 Tax=Kitasatospora aureofaciens TaxID=1894 RepID=UPI00092B4183|nr:hypothetical protein CP971_27840 [Streptomyces viridifaciens]UKZ09097.1 hypothetical protein BOQ63_034770 [Streptomyces viridifaciens]